MTNTLDDICQSGSFCNAFVYHICGMPWAATNSRELKAILDSASAESTTIRQKMFGGESYEDVTILPILQHNLGSQRIEYSEDKGITVGGWSVRLSSDPSGFVWKNGSELEQWGVVGLDWQPQRNAPGAAWSVLASDVVPDLATNTATIEWPAGQDVGVKAWLDDKWSGSAYSENLYLYSASSCFRPNAQAVQTGQGVSVTCDTAQFNSPNERIPSVEDGQSIYLTNYPQGIEGMTANLYGVQIADGGLVSGDGFGHEEFGHFPFGHAPSGEAGDIITTGTTPIFLRSGKVKANATTDNQGRWTISMGGVTDQLKFKSNTARFSGSLYGYEFNRTQSARSFGGRVAWAPYDITIRENNTGLSSSIISITIDGDPAYNSASSKQDLLAKIKNALETKFTSSLCTYTIDDNNDIVWEDKGTTVTSVYITGPAAAAAGLGYVGFKRIPVWLKSLSDPINSNVAQSYVRDDGEPSWIYSLPYDTIQLADTYALCLRPKNITDATFKLGRDNTLDGLGLIRNKGSLEYFIAYDNLQNNLPQQDWSNNLRITEQVPMFVPENAAGDQVLTISKNEASEVPIAAGDALGFGSWDNGLNIYGTVTGVSGDEVTFFANTLYGFPSAMYYCKALPDALNDDNGSYRNEVQNALDLLNKISSGGTEYTTYQDIIALFELGDLFRVTDITAVNSTNPTAILKQLIGDPDTDTGLSNSMIQTSVKNMFERGDALNFVPFIDWTTLDSLMDGRKIAEAQFVFALDEQDSSGTDWMSMLNGICMTHGIEMTYEYTETYKCWWISFKYFNDGSLASATIGGNDIDDTDIASNEVQGQTGGSWLYTNIAASYKSVRNDEINLSYKLRNGRIGHVAKDRVLTVKDKMTLLPINYQSPADTIENTYFSNMLYNFAKVNYKQTLILKMKKAARIGVGRWASAEWSPLLNRITGRRGDGKMSGEVSGMSIDLTGMKIDADIMTTAGGGLAIGPAINIPPSGKSGSVITFTADKDLVDNDYQDPADGLCDLAWFGCFNNIAGVISARDCSCDGFRVTVFERNPSSQQLYFDPAYTYVNQNVWRGTMQKLTLSDVAGSGTTTVNITLDGNPDAYDVSKDYVCIFSDRADALLEPCQTELFGWYGNAQGKVIDSTTAESIAITVDS